MKFRFHPLFLALGVASACFGALPVYLICVLTALLHECGHIFYAGRLGFKCEKISLMPYGASAVCDTDGIRARDEIFLALAGPLVNALVCVLCAGLWWFFPVTYAYTDTVFAANASMLIINLLPAYPLDGGRVAGGALTKFLKPKTVNLVLRGAALVFAAALLVVFFVCGYNVSAITFSLMLACSAFEKSPPAQKINFAAKKKKRGREIKYIILDENATFRDALRFVDSSRYLVIQIYGETFLDEITEDELYARLMNCGIYDRILSS